MRIDQTFLQHLEAAAYAAIISGKNPEALTIVFGHIDGLRIQTKTTPISSELDLPMVIQQAAVEIRNRIQTYMLRNDWTCCTVSFPKVFFSFDSCDAQLLIWFEVSISGKTT